MKRFSLGFALALGLSVPAQADWHVAESDHFVVYADDRAKDVQEFAEALERYHSAMSLLQMRENTKPSPSNRVTIFVVGSEGKIRKLAGENAKNVAGFYIRRAGASRAFVPEINMRGRETDFSVTVLLHEYAHHFLISAAPFAMPRWINEGAAEFFASAKFEKDGGLQIGAPAYHRAAELAYAKDVSVEELIDPELYEKNKGKRFDAFYGRAWALYHYLYFNKERSGQLRDYMVDIAEGEAPRKAAIDAFGDLDNLQKELDRYIDQRRMNVWTLDANMLPTNAVTVRQLSEGEGEVMPLRIRSQRGVDREEALAILPESREIAAQYPRDAGVLTALAEAEYDAGNDGEAIAAADRALANDPRRKNAYVQRGYALFRQAASATDEDAALYCRDGALFRAEPARKRSSDPADVLLSQLRGARRGTERKGTSRPGTGNAACPVRQEPAHECGDDAGQRRQDRHRPSDHCADRQRSSRRRIGTNGPALLRSDGRGRGRHRLEPGRNPRSGHGNRRCGQGRRYRIGPIALLCQSAARDRLCRQTRCACQRDLGVPSAPVRRFRPARSRIAWAKACP